MKKKLKNPYLVTGLLVFVLFCILFIVKKIYPFGNNTLIYGDMHDQITAFYYHFYDVFHGNASLFVDFTTSGGINFWGILAYYILSPVSLLLLFFPREDLYLAVSLVIAIKILIASLTCLYSLRVLFQKKLSFWISILLAISYAFCGYNLLMYQITPWMDAMYLFPLVIVGLKKVLEGEKPYLYLVSLTLSLIFSFYVTSMSLILILLLTFVYLVVFQEKKNWKKRIAALGISTLLAIGMSLFIILPTGLQILESSRLQISMSTVFNSKLGPILDKLSFFLPCSFLLACTLFLLFHWKDHKKFLKWYIPSLLLLGIPYIIEPINKMIHFFSYAYFPNRYGYMIFFFLVLGAGYYFVVRKEKESKRYANVLCIGVSVFVSIVSCYLVVSSYPAFQDSIFHLTISGNRTLFLKMAVICLLFLIGYLTLFYFGRKKSRIAIGCFFGLFFFQLGCNLFLYFGLENYQHIILPPYMALEEMDASYRTGDVYRIKNNVSSMVTNSGMVSRYANLDHFTSLVNGNNLKTLKQFGYHTYWTKTSSKNGTLFADSLLANQYYLTINVKMDEWYEPLYSFTSYYLYRLNQPLSFGYFTENIDFQEEEDTFSFQNRIYQAITGRKDSLFQVRKDFSSHNVEMKEEGEYQTYHIVDPDGTSYLETEITVSDKQVLYFQAFRSFLNGEDGNVSNTMNIYVNDQLVRSKYPSSSSNGTILLGTFEDEVVNIKIEFLKDVSFRYLALGAMDANLWTQFVKEEAVNSDVIFDRNRIQVQVSSSEGGLFFLPVTYDEGYTVKVNGEKQDVVKVYGNYLGVELEKGEQEIQFQYVPKGFSTGMIISCLSFLLAIFLFSSSFYERLLSWQWFSTFASIIYFFLLALVFFFVYFVPFVCFFLSFFFRIL